MPWNRKEHNVRHSRGVLRTLWSLLTTLLLVGVLIVIGVAAWGVRSGDWQAHPVLSGSMEPVLPVGSIAIMRRTPTNALRVGDAITFREPGNPERLITHRIAAIKEKDGQRVYETKGDANRNKDPWQVTLRGDVSYRLHQQLPYVGYTVAWMRQPETRQWFYGAAALVGLWAVTQLFLPERTTGRGERRSTPSSAPDEPTQKEVQL